MRKIKRPSIYNNVVVDLNLYEFQVELLIVADAPPLYP